MELKLKLLRCLVEIFYHKPIPSTAWTPDLVKLFADLKVCVTSSPVTARFDPSKPTLKKTDWSSKGMGCIIMKPVDDEESTKAIAL